MALGQPVVGMVISDGTGRVERTANNGFFAMPTANGKYPITFSKNGTPYLTTSAIVQFGNADVSSDINAAPTDVAPSSQPTVAPPLAEQMTGNQTGTWLSVTGADDVPEGEAGLRYSWSPVDVPPGGSASFPRLDNHTHSARRILATFTKAGTYKFTVTATDANGNTSAAGPGSEVTVVVPQVLASVRVEPRHGAAPGWDVTEIPAHTGRELKAIERDQFGSDMPAQPAKFRWLAVGSASPTVDLFGVFTAAGPLNTASVVAETTVPGTAAKLYGSATLSSWFNDVTMNQSVLGRHVFYNNSAFDENNTGANVQDDAAIDSGKAALRPGGSATFSNYTSYSKGLNGIVFDLSWTGGNLTAEDLVLRVGNQIAGSQTSPEDNDPTLWKVPATPAISVRDRPGGSKRVTLTWDDYDKDEPTNLARAAGNRWLRVAVLNTTRTGLPGQDVFYFGNLIGDTGNNSTGVYATLAEDYSATRNAVDTDPVAEDVLDRYDHNRDGLHTNPDYELIPANYFRKLYLITV